MDILVRYFWLFERTRLSVDELSERTNIAKGYLEALETDASIAPAATLYAGTYVSWRLRSASMSRQLSRLHEELLGLMPTVSWQSEKNGRLDAVLAEEMESISRLGLPRLSTGR